MSKLPPFYVTRTLLGFDPREQDLNRVSLNFPNGQQFVLHEMGEPRTKEQEARWNRLAEELSTIWPD